MKTGAEFHRICTHWQRLTKMREAGLSSKPKKTIQSAAQIGASAVVVHLGYVRMRSFTRKLVNLYNLNKKDSWRYSRVLQKFKRVRSKTFSSPHGCCDEKY